MNSLEKKLYFLLPRSRVLIMTSPLLILVLQNAKCSPTLLSHSVVQKFLKNSILQISGNKLCHKVFENMQGNV